MGRGLGSAGTATYADRTPPSACGAARTWPVRSRARVGLRRIDISPTLCTGRRGGKLIVDGLPAIRMPHRSQRTP